MIIYVFLDFSYVYWVAHWYFKLPVPLNTSVPMALVGLGSRLREGFGMIPQVTTQAQLLKKYWLYLSMNLEYNWPRNDSSGVLIFS